MRSRVFLASFVGVLVIAGCNNSSGGPTPTGGATSNGGQLSGGSGGGTGGAWLRWSTKQRWYDR